MVIPFCKRNFQNIAAVVTVGLAVLVGFLGWRLGLVLVGMLWIPMVFMYLLMRPSLVLAIYAMVLTIYPRARFLISGDVPVYWMDILIGIGLVAIFWHRKTKGVRSQRTTLDNLVLALGLTYLPGFLRLWILTGTLAEGVYFVIRYWLNTFVFFICVYWIRTEKNLRQIVTALYYGTLVVSIWAIFQGIPSLAPLGEAMTRALDQFFGGMRFSFSPHVVAGTPLNRVIGGYTIATVFAGFYALMLTLLAFSLVARDAPKLKVPAWIGLPVMAVGLLLTYSLQGFVATFAGFIAGWAVSWKRPGRLTRGLVAFLLFAIGLLIIASFIPVVGQFAVRQAKRLLNPFDDPNIEARTEIGIPRFLNAVADDPQILFWGQSLVIRKLQKRGLLQDFLFRGFVSNSWLLLILDGGLLPFALYIGVYVVTLVNVARQALAARQTTWLTVVSAGCVASLVASGLAHLSDNYFGGGGALYMRALHFTIVGISAAAFKLGQKKV
jgi:hypothetical protein